MLFLKQHIGRLVVWIEWRIGIIFAMNAFAKKILLALNKGVIAQVSGIAFFLNSNYYKKIRDSIDEEQKRNQTISHELIWHQSIIEPFHFFIIQIDINNGWHSRSTFGWSKVWHSSRCTRSKQRFRIWNWKASGWRRSVWCEIVCGKSGIESASSSIVILLVVLQEGVWSMAHSKKRL